MNRAGIFETFVGLIVVFVAAAFLFYSYNVSGRNLTAGTYELNAVFGRVDGVAVGSEVRVSGVKIGSVSTNTLDPTTYEAKVSFVIDGQVPLPEDSIAKIVADGLLGGAYVSIEPGASDFMLSAGDTITLTQGSVDLLGLAVQSFTGPSAGSNSNSELSE